MQRLLGIIWLSLVFFSVELNAQSSRELDALNSYIDFLNESVHGLVIAHILLVNNNKDLNRYIDLESSKTVNISTKDLPSNIFDKPDDDSDFYEVSPLELSEICFEKSAALKSGLAKKLNGQTKNIVNILNKINQLRFDIENYILSHDLNEKESIYGVYEYLEQAVTLFDGYSNAHNQLATDINLAFNVTENDLYNSLKNIHKISKSFLRNCRVENDNNVKGNITKLNSALLAFLSVVNSTNVKNEYTKSIEEKVSKSIKLIQDFDNPGFVPFEHELYGKHYYYHNQMLIKYFNWSGPGFVRDMNFLLTGLNLPFIQFDEEPLIFKVIYPIKVEEALAIEKKENVLLPKQLKLEDPNMKIHNEPILSNSKLVEIELYDHNMNDRDSVSVSFNGKEILANYTISSVVKKINVELEEGKENYLVFTAKNLGIIPPNTLAIGYRYQGKRKKILLINDLNESEAVEVKLVKP